MNRNNLLLLVVVALLLFGGNLDFPAINPLQPAPIGLDGFNVLVIEDTTIETDADATDVLQDPDVRSALDACDEFYIWDDTQSDWDYVAPEWRAAFDKAIADSDGVRPWILVSGNGGASQAVPSDAAELVALINRFKPGN